MPKKSQKTQENKHKKSKKSKAVTHADPEEKTEVSFVFLIACRCPELSQPMSTNLNPPNRPPVDQLTRSRPLLTISLTKRMRMRKRMRKKMRTRKKKSPTKAAKSSEHSILESHRLNIRFV